MPREKKRIPWNAWGETHAGKQRDNNEDRIHCDARRGIFIVVDGMGGEAAGEEAAQSALACIRKRLAQETGTIPRRIREAITAANNEIYRLSQSKPDWRGMACVLTTAVIEDGYVHIGHVGDTRLYTIRNHEIHKVTPDHSPIGRREDDGELTELEAMRHPRRNEVYRDVGSKPRKPDDEDFVEYIQIPFASDSAVLICSDGLTDMLASTEILKAVERNAGKPRDTVRELIELANQAGGKDNVSAIIVNGEEFALAAREGKVDLSQPGAYPAASAGSLKRHLFRIIRWLSGSWFLFTCGLVCGIVLLSFVQRRDSPPTPRNETGPQPIALQPQTWHVDPASTEFGSIGRALEKAQPGDRVEIAPGEYRESIRLKEGVSVIAQSSGSVILRAPHSLAGDEAVVVADGIRGVDLSGIVIKDGLDAAFPIGIRIVNSDLRVLNVEVAGATKAGVWIDGDSAAIMIGNYIHSNPGTGVVVAGFSKPRLLNNIIQNNGSDKNRTGPGIHIIESAEPDVQRNVIAGNAAEGIRLRQAQMKDRMMNNIFAVTGKPNKAGPIGVEKTGIR